ncbi:MAG: cobyrinate a,c-diamide synthase [candidate division Zixibacteria bacterium]|nr:cobyrinate a,c-diamide synthase [candidate division Zixibacteria bacterium]
MGLRIPRLMVAGLSGDSGKTVVSLSLVAGLRQRGRSVSVFKKGADYIDAAWLGAVAESDCHNLDTYMAPRDTVRRRFVTQAHGAGVAVIEGNRGLFDGMDVEGTHSSAALARLLDTPVVLVVNATKTTRTLAALITGCQSFDSSLNIAGVVINRIAGSRHEAVIRGAIEQYCGLPVVGAIPKLSNDESVIPGRHLGLVTPAEFGSMDELMARLTEIAAHHLDIEWLIEISERAAPMDEVSIDCVEPVQHRTRIAFFKDAVFTFYYPENLEALEANGAELVPLSALDTAALPDDIDGLYIGGGFPETQVERLVANRAMMTSVKQAAEDGLPIYAECGGLIYLCRSLVAQDGCSYPMAALFGIDLKMHRRPVGHGYVEVEVDQANPFFEVGEVLRGHEFHYTGPVADTPMDGCMKVRRGVGLGQARDGLVYKSAMTCYTHLHADGVPGWAPAFVEAASTYRAMSRGSIGGGSVAMNLA